MAITFQVKRNEKAMYKVSHPWPNNGEKKPLPFVCRKCHSWLKSTAEGLKIHEMARKVSGIIERMASVVANAVPNRSPRTAGMASRIRPTTEMPSVHQVMDVPRGEIEPDVSLNRSAM